MPMVSNPFDTTWLYSQCFSQPGIAGSPEKDLSLSILTVAFTMSGEFTGMQSLQSLHVETILHGQQHQSIAGINLMALAKIEKNQPPRFVKHSHLETVFGLPSATPRSHLSILIEHVDFV